METTETLPQVNIYASFACNHTIDSLCGQQISCNYQLIICSGRLALYHVIYFKYGCSKSLLVNKPQVQYRLNMKGEIERIYESMRDAALCSASQLQPASSIVVGCVLDAALLYNLQLLYNNCTDSILNRSPKLYLENVLHIASNGVVFRLFCNSEKVERNFNVAFKVFLKNITNLVKHFLYIKRTSEKKTSPNSNVSSMDTPCSEPGVLCKFKQYRERFSSFDHTSIHNAMCVNGTLIDKFQRLEYLALSDKTKCEFDRIKNMLLE